MSTKRFCCPLLLIAVVSLAIPAALFAAEPSAAPALPEIWIKSGAHLVNIPPNAVRTNETGAMWEADAPWPTVASHVKVAVFPPGNIQWAKDEDLQKAFSEMKRRNIALALGTGLLTRTDHCQAKNEAVGAPGEFEQMLVKIQRNGGEVSYIAMDEPYFYGHRDPSGCHESAAELAKNVAANVAAARKIFPKIKIGDIEVVGANRPFIDELAAWADAYQAAVGEKLAFMQTDVAWSELAMQNLKPLAQAMKARNIPLGVTYNSTDTAHTDESWQQSAEDHIAEIETVLHIHPDIAVFDSWTPNPAHALPETKPGTLTNIALRYLRAPTSLTLQRTSDDVSGRLTDQHGAAAPKFPSCPLTAVQQRDRSRAARRAQFPTTPRRPWSGSARVSKEPASAMDRPQPWWVVSTIRSKAPTDTRISRRCRFPSKERRQARAPSS